MQKNFGLDVVRSLAIIFVLIDHSQPFWDKTWPGDFVANVGVVGVELFFVLSGFLLGERLSNMSANGIGVSAQNVREFFRRRWLRTLPAYFAMLLIIFLIDGKLNLRFLIFMQAFDPPMMARVFAQSWSLSIEEMFYLFFPLVIYISGLKFVHVKTTKICFISCIFIIIIFPLLRYILYIYGYRYWDIAYHSHPFLRMDSFAIGVLGFYFQKFSASSVAKLTAYAFFIVSFIYFVFHFNDFIIYASTFQQSVWQAALFLPVSFVCVLFVFAMSAFPKCPQRLIQKMVSICSTMTYAVYLTHLLVFQIVQRWTFGQYPPIIRLFFGFMLMVPAAAALHFLVEKPFLRLRDRNSPPSRSIAITEIL